MATTIKKYQIQQKTNEGELVLHPETTAEIVQFEDKTNSTPLTSTNVQDALVELQSSVSKIKGGVVTGVKGDSETAYRTGEVNITKANIGLGNVNNVAITADQVTQIGTNKTNIDGLTTKTSTLESDVTTLKSDVSTLKSDSSALNSILSGVQNKLDAVETTANAAIPSSLKGAANGVATLGTDGKVPSSQLPSYVDDVLEYANKAAFPTTGESGKIYVALDTNLTYRWGGTGYVEISASLALGETSSTAYAGDKGKALETKVATIEGNITTMASDLENTYNLATNTATGLNAVISGTTVVGKAKADGDGNVISTTYAKDANVVHKTGNETIEGVKTFSGGETRIKGQIRVLGSKDYESGNYIVVTDSRIGTNTGEAYIRIDDSGKFLYNNGSDEQEIATLNEIPEIPNLSTASSGSGTFISGISTSGHKITYTKSTIANSDLPNSGVAEGTYSAVKVNTKGIVTAGANMIEVGTTTDATPSSNLAIGGLFFKLLS